MSNAPPLDEMTPMQRMVLRYLHHLATTVALRSVNYRQCRAQLAALLSPGGMAKGKTGRFNWGFETQFAHDLGELQDWGLIQLRVGPRIGLGATSRREAIHSLGLTSDGESCALELSKRYRLPELKALDSAPSAHDDAAHDGKPEKA